MFETNLTTTMSNIVRTLIRSHPRLLQVKKLWAKKLWDSHSPSPRRGLRIALVKQHTVDKIEIISLWTDSLKMIELRYFMRVLQYSVIYIIDKPIYDVDRKKNIYFSVFLKTYRMKLGPLLLSSGLNLILVCHRLCYALNPLIDAVTLSFLCNDIISRF